MGSTKTYSVLLSCGHYTRRTRERLGDIAPCKVCQEWAEQRGYWSREWRATCQNPACRYDKWFGQDKVEAQRIGTRHHTPTHPVVIAYDSLDQPPVRSRQADPGCDTLFSLSELDTPPF